MKLYYKLLTIVFAFLALPLFGQESSVAFQKELAQLEETIENIRIQWNVPGLAIAVVHREQTIYTKGFGYRNLEKQLPVTGETLFPVGSITKSMAVGAAMALQDEGKLTIDQPLGEYIPFFRMADEYVTQEVTLRDFMLHRTGLPRHDPALFESGYSQQELFNRLEYFDFAKPFRTNFLYSNFNYMIVGQVLEIVEQKPYDQVIGERIFQKLSMPTANMSIEVLLKSDNYATGYSAKDMVGDMTGPIKQVPYRPVRNASGAANASVVEMANWVNLLMNKGKFGGQQVLSEKAVADMLQPQISLNWKGHDPGGYWVLYGLGLDQTSFKGYEMVAHGGDIDGFQAQMAFLPGERIGVVVLTNKDQSGIARFIHKMIFDKLLNLSKTDYNQLTLAAYQKTVDNIAMMTAQQRQVTKKGAPHTHALTDFAGTYEHPGYHKIEFHVQGDSLHFTYGNYKQALRHYHYNTFAASRQGFDIPINFRVNTKGDIEEVNIMLEPALGKPINFTRVYKRGK